MDLWVEKESRHLRDVMDIIAFLLEVVVEVPKELAEMHQAIKRVVLVALEKFLILLVRI
jgi:hypothetical protein